MKAPTTFAIAILRNFYHHDIQGQRSVLFVQEEGQKHPEDYKTYDTLRDALDAVDEMDYEVYYLSHNEADRPEYVIVDADVADYIISGRGGDMSNYDWDDCDCDNCDADGNACGQCNVCIDMMIDQDIDHVRDNAVEEASA